MKSNFHIRFAQENDVPIILSMIRALACYEKMSPLVTATESLLHESLFMKKQAEVLLGFEDDVPVGFALYFYNFSTFLGHANLYLEDLYVDESYRKKGYGKALLIRLAEIAIENGCQRLDWSCLKWNQPSIDFYHSLNAINMSEWMLFRLKDQDLVRLAQTNKKDE